MQGRILTQGGLAILGILLLCFAALWLQGRPHPVEPGVALRSGLALVAGETHRESIHIGAVTPKLRMELHSSGAARVTLGGDEKKCKTGDCVLVFNPEVRDASVELAIRAESDTRVSVQDLTLVKYQLNTTLHRFEARDWFLALGLLLAALLVNAVAYRQPPISQWSTIGLTLFFLAYNDVLFTLCLLAYLVALHAMRRAVNTGRNRHWLALLLFNSVCFLLLFKYGKEAIFRIFANPGGFDLLMPIGISYFIIRLLDTQLRWYRRDSLDVSFREFLYFIIFPGTLVAGPIEDIRHFYEKRLAAIRREDVAAGLARILIGIFKKVVIADGFLLMVMQGQALQKTLWQGGGGSVDALVAAYATAPGSDIFAFAIAGLLFAYLDFSAYSDMAIGTSRLFGHRIRENFDWPVLAPNIREYWKRWHISLSDWSFRNIYFPALVKSQNPYLPLYLTMLGIGLWHAFNLSWFSWALHHATGMTIVGLAQKHLKPGAGILFWLRPLRTALTVLYASLGFVFVYFSDYDVALALYMRYWYWLFSWAGL